MSSGVNNKKSKLKKEAEYMKIFKKKISMNSNTLSHGNTHTIGINTEHPEKFCTSCGKPITGDLYYCLFCRKYYDIECVTKTIGGYVCPKCNKLTFLKPAKVSS